MVRARDDDLVALAGYAEQQRLGGDPAGFLSGAAFTSDFQMVLGGCISFVPEVPESECGHIVAKVAIEAASSGPIKAAGLLDACSKLEKEYLKRPKRKFRLLTEISLWSSIRVPRTVVNEATLTFKPRLRLGFERRSELLKQAQRTLLFSPPTNYMPVSALVHARTPAEAAEKALNALDLTRASWNLALNRSKDWRYSSGPPHPVNDIRLAPFHTVHEAGGALATEAYWYDPGYVRPGSVFSDNDRFGRLLAFSRNLRSRLAKLGYREDIEGALRRYVRALDSADLHDAFLRLWSLLEYLTDSTHDPYKVATRRAAFMFKDHKRAQLLLAHLTTRRNRFVHAGSDAEDMEALVFQLKRYVDALLLFHLGNSFGLDTRADAARFMDLPPDRKQLNLRIRRLRAAKKFTGA